MNIKLRKLYYRHKLLVIFTALLLFVVIFFSTLNFTLYINLNLPNNANSNAFCSLKTLVYVQKSQAELTNNTIMYYKNILEKNNKYNVDGFVVTVFLTKDNKLAVSSYATLDSFTDCNNPPFNEKNVKISTKTIGELKQYNSAYNIKINGEYPYQNSGADLTYARIITLNELLDYLKTQNQIWKKSFKLIITLADDDAIAVQALNNTLNVYNYASFCIVQTNSNKLAKTVNEYPNLLRTATYTETLGYFYSTAFNIKNPTVDYNMIYLDNWQYGMHFGKSNFAKYAHFCGVPIIYKNAHTLQKIEKYTRFSPDGIAGSLPEDIYLATIK